MGFLKGFYSKLLAHKNGCSWLYKRTTYLINTLLPSIMSFIKTSVRLFLVWSTVLPKAQTDALVTHAANFSTFSYNTIPTTGCYSNNISVEKINFLATKIKPTRGRKWFILAVHVCIKYETKKQHFHGPCVFYCLHTHWWLLQQIFPYLHKPQLCCGAGHIHTRSLSLMSPESHQLTLKINKWSPVALLLRVTLWVNISWAVL